MKNQPKEQKTQQGYILVVALLAMLFIGVVFIGSISRSGTEERIAISQLHTASLESALYAGLYKVDKVSKAAYEEADKSDVFVLCTLVKNAVTNELKGINNEFLKISNQEESSNKLAIFWKLKGAEGCDKDTNIDFELIAWQGEEADPVSLIKGLGTVEIEVVIDSTGIVQALKTALGTSAAKTSGTISASGGAKIIGDTTGNKIKVNGGAEILQGNLTYQNLDVPSWYQGKEEEDFWYNTAEKKELNSAIVADPLGLKKAVTDSFYIDKDGKEIALTDLATTKISSAFSDLEQGNKKEMGQYPFQRARITPEKFEVYNADWRIEDYQEVNVPVYNSVYFFGEEVDLRALEDFKIKSGGNDPSLTVSGGKVVLFIDGDVELDGGASLQIDADSSLTLIVTGEFKLAGGFDFLNESAVNESGEPLFTLLSSNTDLKSAVKISGGTKLYGVVYSLSDLNLGGSGTIVGQAFGANINANGGTAIEFKSSLSGSGTGSETSIGLDSDFKIDY